MILCHKDDRFLLSYFAVDLSCEGVSLKTPTEPCQAKDTYPDVEQIDEDD